MDIRRVVAGWLVVALILGWAVTPIPAQASPQGGTQLRLLEPVNGVLDAATPEATYSFELNEELVFSVVEWNRSGDLVAELTVFDANGKAMGEGFPIGDSGTVTVVEALVAPSDGTYSVTVRASGGTAGEYGLMVMPGYSFLDKYDDFESADEGLNMTWEPSVSNSSASSLVNGGLQMQVMASDTLSYLSPSDDLTWTDLYIEAAVEIEGSPSYYEYGFLLRLNPDTTEFYALSMSSQLDWTLLYYDGSDWFEVMPWTESPLITDDTNLRVGVYVQGNLFKVYFNDQYVGEVEDTNNYLSEGTIALVAASARDQTDQVTINYDNVVITSPNAPLAGEPNGDGAGLTGILSTATAVAGDGEKPTPSSGLPFGSSSGHKPTTTPSAPDVKPTSAFSLPTVPPIATDTPQPQTSDGTVLESWNSGSPSEIVGELEGFGFVPSGGSVTLNVPTSFGDTSSSGFNFYPLGQGRTFRNFVLSFDAHLDLTGPESGCGMHFRNNASSYSIGMVTEDGAALLAQVNDGEFHPATVFDYFSAVNSGQGSLNKVVIVALEEMMLMYVNGQLIAADEFTAQSGTVALEVFVAENDLGQTQRTYCQLDNIWLWEF